MGGGERNVSGRIPEAIVQTLETIDAAAALDMTRAAPPDVAGALGIAATAHGAAVAMMASRVDVLGLNRVAGLGVDAPATPWMLDTIIAGYRSAGVPRFFVQVSPSAQPAELTQWLAARGLAHYNNWMKLYRGLEDLPDARTDLAIEEISPEHAAAFAEICATAFDFPERSRPWLAASVGRPRWRHYMAFDGKTPAATGAMFVMDDVAWFGYATTAEIARRRGAQSALVARRLADARAMGCRWIVVETAEDKPDKRAPSFHNLRRLGFEVAYLRANYIWKAEG
jgi:GNAT superfamily N-acetyltransferase